MAGVNDKMINYYFGFKKNNKINIISHKFIINADIHNPTSLEQTEGLIGQFISSNWFSEICYVDSAFKTYIIETNKTFDYESLENFMNNNYDNEYQNNIDNDGNFVFIHNITINQLQFCNCYNQMTNYCNNNEIQHIERTYPIYYNDLNNIEQGRNLKLKFVATKLPFNIIEDHIRDMIVSNDQFNKEDVNYRYIKIDCPTIEITKLESSSIMSRVTYLATVPIISNT